MGEAGFDPLFDDEDLVVIRGDILIIAAGQGPERDFLVKEGLLGRDGRLPVDPLTLQLRGEPDIFIGGDLRHIGFMADAMEDGRQGAESIDRFLRREDLRSGRERELVPQDTPLRRQYRQEPDIVWIPPEKRLHFELFEQGFTLQEAVEEARRCLDCGPCTSCRACLEAGLRKQLSRAEVQHERCCGCGVCVAACPYGAVQIRVQGGRRTSTCDRFLCKGCGGCVVACPSAARRLVGEDGVRLPAGEELLA
jgi:Fe-S-cluster-containing hydrogenase component 2